MPKLYGGREHIQWLHQQNKTSEKGFVIDTQLRGLLMRGGVLTQYPRLVSGNYSRVRSDRQDTYCGGYLQEGGKKGNIKGLRHEVITFRQNRGGKAGQSSNSKWRQENLYEAPRLELTLVGGGSHQVRKKLYKAGGGFWGGGVLGGGVYRRWGVATGEPKGAKCTTYSEDSLQELGVSLLK